MCRAARTLVSTQCCCDESSVSERKNCRALLPRIQGLPVTRQLDDYLGRDVNDFPGNFHGSIEALIKQNRAQGELL